MTRVALNYNVILNEQDKVACKRMEGQNRAEESNSNSRLIYIFPVPFRNIGIYTSSMVVCSRKRRSNSGTTALYLVI